MEPDKKDQPQLVATLDIRAEGKDKKIDDVEEPLVKVIFDIPQEQWKTIRSMKLSCNSYGPAVFTKFGKMLQPAAKVEALDISDCFMGRKKEQMAESIYNIVHPLVGGNIAEINISNNALGTTGARIFAPFLEKLPKLKTLLIANCGLGSIGAKEICERIIHCKTLEVFSIGKNRLDVEGGLVVGEALKFLPNLRVLMIFQNGIRKHAMESILDAVYQHIKGLEVLDISDNFAYGEAITKLTNILKDPSFKIRALNLSDCIDKDDLKVIINALKEGHEVSILERFGLNNVELRDSALAELVLEFLEKCPLKYLEIQGTELNKKMRKAYEEKLEAKVGKLAFKDEENDEAELVNAFGSMKINDK